MKNKPKTTIICPVCGAQIPPTPELATGRAHHVNYTTGRDKNGNKTLRCYSVEGGFTIQTNGNLPRTHRDGVTASTDAEVCEYVARHGNARRRRILGI